MSVDLLEVGAAFDLAETEKVIAGCVVALREVVDTHADTLRDALDPDEGDERVAEELIEEELENELRQSEAFHGIVDQLSDEMEKRFSTLTTGELRRNRQGWPVSWS